jgi:hypothetical protein
MFYKEAAWGVRERRSRQRVAQAWGTKMANDEAAILVVKAATDLRKAAMLDKKRRAELESLAEYLESIIYEKELGYDEPLYPEAERTPSVEDEIMRMIKPFRVRLTR